MPTSPDSVTYNDAGYGVQGVPAASVGQSLLLKQPAYLAMATQRAMPDAITVDAVSNTLNSRMGLTTSTSAAVTDIILSYPQFAQNNPEEDFGVTYSVTAAIEYPAGTFTPVYTSGGSRTLSVAPGRGVVSFQPCPIYIPAGTRFWVKTFASWTPGNFQLSAKCASWVSGDGTARGTGLSDNTLVAGTPTTTSTAGFGPSVYGRLSNPCAVVGVIGDSICQTAAEAGDNVTGWQFLQRAMRGAIPLINLGRNSDSMAFYLQRFDGRSALLRDHISHVIMALGRNDCGVSSLATMQSNYQKIIGRFLTLGIPVFGNTITPYTTSTDGWITAENQTIVTSGDREVTRQAFNAWLRANWKALGLTRLYDWALAVDPSNTGKWNFDPTGTGRSAQGFPVLTNGVVTSCVMGQYLLVNNSGGQAYTANSVVPCTVSTYPGGQGMGATITGNVNGSGLVTSYNVIAGGSNYLWPPMVSPNGSWTHDGIHPDSRGYDRIITGCSIKPEDFAL